MNDDLLHVQRDIDGIPGGWKYTVPETGVTLTAGFAAQLVGKVVKHLKANGHEVDVDKLLLIEDGMCRETRPPGSRCAKRPPKPIDGMPLPLLSAVENFLKCIWNALLTRKFVPRQEAERRLAICMACPLRGEAPSGCTGCYTLLRKANSLMERKGALTIEPDPDGTVRDSCKACLCVVPLKVWLDNATLNRCEGEKRPPYAEGCWRLEK